MSVGRPDVSVIIPCYNGERFVADAIASVLSQEGGVVEVIVVDDGSRDASSAAVAGIDDPRVLLVRHGENRGIAAARNTGLDAARADVVAFLDQDDAWLPDRLPAQLAALRAGEPRGVGVVFCDVEVEDERGRRAHRRRVPRAVATLDPEALIARLLTDVFVVLGACLVRRACIAAAGRFNEGVRGGSDDFDMVVRLAEHCRFAHVARTLFRRHEHGANYTRVERMMPEVLGIVDAVERRHPALARPARIARARALCRLGRAAQLAHDRAEAARRYRRALGEWPRMARAWLGLALCGLGPAGDAVSSAWARLRGG